MKTTVIGDEKAADEALAQMKSSPYNHPDTKWAAYQNHDLGSRNIGHLQFLAIGPQNTFKEAPARAPDGPSGLGWRYVYVGWINLETGKVE